MVALLLGAMLDGGCGSSAQPATANDAAVNAGADARSASDGGAHASIPSDGAIAA